jgi:hypothetical protein
MPRGLGREHLVRNSSVSEPLCWIGSSKDKLKNAESSQGMRSMRKTEPFGSKQLRVGKSNLELCNTDSPHHRVLPVRADSHCEEGSRDPAIRSTRIYRAPAMRHCDVPASD